jgi:hypothetical protein
MPPCWTSTSPKRSHVFNIHLHASLNINRTLMSNQPMVQKPSTWKMSTHPHHWTKKGKKCIQEVIGTFLYYARCVDSTMLPALGSLATQQANPTQKTKKLVHQLLDYAATHPNAIITYQARDMVLTVHSNASYLLETNAHSRAGRHFFMSNDEAIPSNNGAILTILQIIKAVMSSTAEAEIAALYINCKEAIPA